MKRHTTSLTISKKEVPSLGSSQAIQAEGQLPHAPASQGSLDFNDSLP